MYNEEGAKVIISCKVGERAGQVDDGLVLFCVRASVSPFQRVILLGAVQCCIATKKKLAGTPITDRR